MDACISPSPSTQMLIDSVGWTTSTYWQSIAVIVLTAPDKVLMRRAQQQRGRADDTTPVITRRGCRSTSNAPNH